MLNYYKVNLQNHLNNTNHFNQQTNIYPRYLLSNEFADYLDISQRGYTLKEIKKIVSEKIFNGDNTKIPSVNDKIIFRTNRLYLEYDWVVDYILSNYIIDEVGCPPFHSYSYNQIPINVSSIQYYLLSKKHK